jgi:hypothetical protein
LGTTLSEVADLFLTRVDDYRLDTIYQTSGSAGLNDFLEPWLEDSIVDFYLICDQVLNYTADNDTDEGTFDIDLTLRNKIILSRLMTKYWLQREVNNILQMNNLLQDHDFRQFAASQNLDAKRQYLNGVKEELSQLLGEYSYSNVNWANWKNQNFDGMGW